MNNRFRSRLFFATMIFSVLFISRFAGAAIEDMEFSKKPPISPAWVFDHWVWEDDVNTQDAVFKLIDGYEEHGIPVGAVVIDSPWATEYNNFEFNREAYPDPEGMIEELHSRGIKVILWMSSMLNTTAGGGNFEPTTFKSYDEGQEKGYFCLDGETISWWKGDGAFIDYTNPEALDWWHGMMDRVIDIGVDGWKADGTDPFFPADGFCQGGPMHSGIYKNYYYGDSYEYIKSKNPQAISWSRSIDLRMSNPSGFAPISHSPANWVGDQKHDWTREGFLEALQDIFDSAKLGYTVVGSDIAGYHGSEPITPQLLIRWTQFGALNPLMENGGHGAHEPWKHSPEIVEIYRWYVKLHLALKPYFYSMMIKGHEKEGPIMHPLSGDWQYVLGDDIFVAVMYTPENSREIEFPRGKWHDFWTPENVYEKDQVINYDCPLDKYPIFIKQGAIIPLDIVDSELGIGDESFKGKVTLDIYPGKDSRFILSEENLDRAVIEMKMSDKNSLSISSSGGQRDYLIRILGDKPVRILQGDIELGETDTYKGIGEIPGKWAYDSGTGRIFINPGPGENLEIQVAY